MASLFAGTPLTAPSYAATTSDVPKWLQDYTVDLFSQQRAVAGTPYQPYALPRIAQTTAPTTASQNLIQSSVGAYQPAVGSAISGTQGLAGQSSVNNISAYMNPYTQNVTDQIARLGARNLSENLLPAVSDQFIRAGQFGSSGMGTFGERALRDTQESILSNQTSALNTGYTQALGASQADLTRQAAAQQQVADLAKMQQGLTTADAAALESVGTAQQQRQQRGLDVAYQDYQNQIQYPQTQINNMSTTLRGLPPTAVPTTGTTSGYTTTFAPSPLSNIAAAYGTYKGLTTAAKGGLIKGYADGGAVTQDPNAQELSDLEKSVMADYGQYHYKTVDIPQRLVNPTAMPNWANVIQRKPNAAEQRAKQLEVLSTHLPPGVRMVGNQLQIDDTYSKYSLDNPAQLYNSVRQYANQQNNLDLYNAKLAKEGKPAVTGIPKSLSRFGVNPMAFGQMPNANPYKIPGYNSLNQAALNGVNNMGMGLASRLQQFRQPAPIAEGTRSMDDALQQYLNKTGNNMSLDALKQQIALSKAPAPTINPQDLYSSPAVSAAPDMSSQLADLNAKYYSQPVAMSHGGRVPGYAQEGYVDTENPADLVDGGQAFADQYAQGQQDYPAQQDAPVYQGQGPGPIIGRDALNALVTKYGGLGDDAIKQLADINTQRTAARNDYNTQIAKLEAMQPQGPSESEKWLNFAAAFADPGKTGSFGEGMGHAATSLAAHKKANREYQQEFMKNQIMAGLKRGEFTMEDLARQEKSTVDMAQLGINSQEKLAALLEKVNAGERNRLAGITVHFNDANGEITTVDKGTNLVTTLRVADIPENVRVEILKDATKRAEGYAPEEKTAKIEQFMKDNLAAYAKTRTAIKSGTSTTIPSLAPTSTGSGTPSHTGNTITPAKGPSFQGAPVDIMKDLSRIPNEADKIAAGKQYEQQLSKPDVGYTSPFGQYVVAPPRARITTGEQTPQQKTEFEGQAAANLDEAKLFNTRVNEASAAGSAGVAAANQLLTILPKIPNTGTLAPYRQQLGSVFGSLGIPGDITDSAGMLSIAQAAVSSSVLGQQLLQKGVQTEGDAKRMEMAGPTLTQPKTAVEFLTRTAKATGLRQLEMSAFRDDWRRYNQSDLGMGDAWNKYLNATPMTALMPNNKLMFVNEYVDEYMKAHPEGTPEQRRGAALRDWRKLGGM